MTFKDAPGLGARWRGTCGGLARKYTGQDYAAPVGPQGRVILKVAPDKVNTPRRLSR